MVDSFVKQDKVHPPTYINLKGKVSVTHPKVRIILYIPGAFRVPLVPSSNMDYRYSKEYNSILTKGMET